MDTRLKVISGAATMIENIGKGGVEFCFRTLFHVHRGIFNKCYNLACNIEAVEDAIGYIHNKTMRNLGNSYANSMDKLD